VSQVALTLPGLAVPTWQVRCKNDPAACALADRHYSRRRPGSGQVGPPGRKLVLVTPCERAVWLTHWPDADKAMDGLDCWRCSIFRNEAPAELLSSHLIRAAMNLTASLWAARPTSTPGWVTWVDPAKVASPNPGYCFKQAGWTLDHAWSHPRLVRLRAPILEAAPGRPLGGVEVCQAADAAEQVRA
jgi:hypothetical protein